MRAKDDLEESYELIAASNPALQTFKGELETVGDTGSTWSASNEILTGRPQMFVDLNQQHYSIAFATCYQFPSKYRQTTQGIFLPRERNEGKGSRTHCG